MYTTLVRPDSAHPSVVVAASWLRRTATTGHLVAGTTQPGGGDWPGDAKVPETDVSSLVATFNSGWKYDDIDGGFYLAGRTGDRLQIGDASVVIHHDGQVTIGAWGAMCA